MKMGIGAGLLIGWCLVMLVNLAVWLGGGVKFGPAFWPAELAWLVIILLIARWTQK